MRCDNCKVNIPYNENCPLCGRFTGRTGERAYPSLGGELRRKGIAGRVVLFVFIALSALFLLLDLMTSDRPDWSAAAVGGMAAACVAVALPFFTRLSFGRYVLYDCLALFGYCLLLDMVFSRTGWAVSAIIPAAASAGIAALFVAALAAGSRWPEISACLFTLCAAAALHIAAGAAGLLRLHPVAMWLFAGDGLALLFLWLFTQKRMQREVVKKFHA